MGVAGEDSSEIFPGWVWEVQFLHKDKLFSKMINEDKSLLTKMFSSVNLNSEFSYFL